MGFVAYVKARTSEFAFLCIGILDLPVDHGSNIAVDKGWRWASVSSFGPQARIAVTFVWISWDFLVLYPFANHSCCFWLLYAVARRRMSGSLMSVGGLV